MAAAAANIAQDDVVHAELLTGRTGVRITGFRAPDVSDAQVEEVKRLISTYCVGVFPGQYLGPEDQVRFVSRFGPITFTPGEDEHPDWRRESRRVQARLRIVDGAVGKPYRQELTDTRSPVEEPAGLQPTAGPSLTGNRRVQWNNRSSSLMLVGCDDTRG